jgi:hypothetical protein
MKQASLYFTAPRCVEIREKNLSFPSGREVLVKTLFSAISPGSELLVYRGLCPDDLPLDETIPSLKGRAGFPTKYGYSVVGRVISCGENAPPEWEGRLVFCFHPHESHFLADPQELHPLPPDVSPEEALFLPNLETARHLQGQVRIGWAIVLVGFFCPFFWIALFTGIRGQTLYFNALHSGLVMLFGFGYLMRSLMELARERRKRID